MLNNASKRVSTRWSAPRVTLTQDNIRKLLGFIAGKHEPGLYAFFKQLAMLTSAQRLARNLSELMKKLSSHDVDDVLRDGLSEFEYATLASLEQLGISLQLLGVAHSLLNIRERRLFAKTYSDNFEELRNSNVMLAVEPLSTEFLQQLREKKG